MIVTPTNMTHGNIYQHINPRFTERFITNFINPNTKYDTLLLVHSTGVGKTITALSAAINFI